MNTLAPIYATIGRAIAALPEDHPSRAELQALRDRIRCRMTTVSLRKRFLEDNGQYAAALIQSELARAIGKSIPPEAATVVNDVDRRGDGSVDPEWELRKAFVVLVMPEKPAG